MAEATGGGGSGFPATRLSAIAGVMAADPAERARCRDVLSRIYWKPIYKYVRLRWRKPPDEAEDVTQEFFLRCLDQDTFAVYRPEQARFRTFLRSCLDRFVTDQYRRATAQKRGGGEAAVDVADAEREIAAAPAAARSDPEALFAAEWARHILALAIDALRRSLGQRGKERQLEVFERHHLGEGEPPTYAETAAALGVAVHDVTNWLSYARREFRRLALDLLREVTVSEDEFQDEARALFGPDAIG